MTARVLLFPIRPDVATCCACGRRPAALVVDARAFCGERCRLVQLLRDMGLMERRA